MAIDATNPTVEPEVVVPAKTYDKWWVRRFLVRSNDPNGPASVMVDLQKYAEVDGVREFGSEHAFVEIEDLFARAASDVELATIMESLFAKIKAIGDEQGVL